MFRILPLLLVGFLALPSGGCAKTPPTLSPQGKAAFQKTQVLKSLDLLRDIAIDAESAGVLKTDDTRKVVEYHRSAIQVMHASDTGWRAAVVQGLDELQHGLPAAAAEKIAPYVALLRAVLAEASLTRCCCSLSRKPRRSSVS